MTNTTAMEAAVARARVARTARKYGPHHPETEQARADYYTASLAEHIKAVVNKAPTISQAQRDKLAALLRPSSDRGAAA